MNRIGKASIGGSANAFFTIVVLVSDSGNGFFSD